MARLDGFAARQAGCAVDSRGHVHGHQRAPGDLAPRVGAPDGGGGVTVEVAREAGAEKGIDDHGGIAEIKGCQR